MNRLILVSILSAAASAQTIVPKTAGSSVPRYEQSSGSIDSRTEIFTNTEQDRDLILAYLGALYPDAVAQDTLSRNSYTGNYAFRKRCEKDYADKEFVVEIAVEKPAPAAVYECKSAEPAMRARISIDPDTDPINRYAIAAALVEALYPDAEKTPLDSGGVSYAVKRYSLDALPKVYVLQKYLDVKFLTTKPGPNGERVEMIETDSDDYKSVKDGLTAALAGKIAAVFAQRYTPPAVATKPPEPALKPGEWPKVDAAKTTDVGELLETALP